MNKNDKTKFIIFIKMLILIMKTKLFMIKVDKTKSYDLKNY